MAEPENQNGEGARATARPKNALLSVKEVMKMTGLSEHKARQFMLAMPHVRVGKLLRVKRELIEGMTPEKFASVMARGVRLMAPSSSERAYYSKYGITLSDRDQLLASQNGRCAICERELKRWGSGSADARVDHCHVAGHIRGVLCNGCNRGIGSFYDNAAAMRRAAEYIERSAPVIHQGGPDPDAEMECANG